MKKLKFLIWLVALIALINVEAKAGQITHMVTYDPSQLSITYDTIDGNAYARVSYEGLNCSGYVSQPALPHESMMFYLPYDATNISIKILVNDSTLYSLTAPVVPVPLRYNNNNSINDGYFCDSITYNSNHFIPEKSVEIEGVGYIYGDNHVLVVGFHPFTFNPNKSELKFVNQGTIIVDYDLSNQTNAPHISRGNNELREKEQNELKKKVVNPEMLSSSNSNNLRDSYTYIYNNALDSAYTYCIITKRHLADSFRKIIALKRQKGISAGVVCLEDLKLDERYNHGDWHEHKPNYIRDYINDDAGVVREYLKYAYGATHNATEYVLLGGDKDNCPIRYGGYLYDNVGYYATIHKTPTDLYFSNLTSDWDMNNNLNFGEISKMKALYGNNMYYPDIFVGRLLCQSDVEIENYTKKVVNYALHPKCGNDAYLTKALICQSGGLQYNEGCAYFLSNQINTSLPDFSIDVVQEENGNIPIGKEVIDTLNTNYGYVSLNGHGSPLTITVGEDQQGITKYAIKALEDYPYINFDYYLDFTYEDNNSFDYLTNKEKPNVIYSIACSTMPFDIHTERVSLTSYNTYDIPYNIGQVLTTYNKNFGAVAYLGYTRPSYGGYSLSAPCATNLELQFLQEIETNKNIGKAEALSKFNCNIYDPDSYLDAMKFAHNLLGDPELEMWTSEPQQYTGITVNKYDTYITITGVNRADIIGCCDNDGNVRKIENVYGNYTINGTSPSTSVMVYDYYHEYIPYIAPMLLQNCNINNSQYVYASSFSAGRSVSSFMSNGNVTIKNGAIYEIEASGDVHLGEGFIVENGATFAIKTPGKVTIDGCVFQCGAKVKIEAGKVEIVKSFTAERGSKVELTQFIDY